MMKTRKADSGETVIVSEVEIGVGELVQIIRSFVEPREGWHGLLEDFNTGNPEPVLVAALREALGVYDGGLPAPSQEPRRRKVTESHVPGHLLIRFNKEWPEGWSWAASPALWGETERDVEEFGEDLLEEDKTYDLRDWELTFDGLDGSGDGRNSPLWSFFRRWWKAQDDYDGAKP